MTPSVQQDSHTYFANARPHRGHAFGCAALGLLLAAGTTIAQENPAQRLTREQQGGGDGAPSTEADATLYAVGYAHLDTQWRWDYVQTIDQYLRDTLDQNFALFEKYPDYVFNFTGSVRYEMLREYYPEDYERVKQYIAEGRWHVSGSSVDEGDVNVPSPEGIIRQVLYGNLFFEREFGKVSTDFMLPDCFGFPWSMPSIWSHCGLLGFSTQKLTWGSAVGIPFDIGIWEGPDGNGVIAALNPGSYSTQINTGPADQDPTWDQRIREHGERYGIWADYHYYGVGDVGGAPRESAVQNYTANNGQGDDSLYRVGLVASDDLYEDISTEQRANLPRYSGDMLLTEHSAGTLTSQSYMKRWNRQAELLLASAETASVAGWWLGAQDYPRGTLERAWVRVLGNQMHDILPGTSLPRAYTYSWNDEIVAMNLGATAIETGVGSVAMQMDTRVQGTPAVVYNPLAIEREDLVEATIDLGGAAHARVFDPDGNEIPSQIIDRDGSSATVLFSASAPAAGYAVYDIRGARTPFDDGRGPMIEESGTLENDVYRVTLDENGDLASVYDKRAYREILSAPAGLVFTYERPQNYPAWNMDWKDRRKPPTGRVDGPVSFRVVEQGPVRVSLEVTREARNSKFTQTISLARESDRVDIEADIDWQSTETALKASFPLTVSNPVATYSWGLGTIERGNNDPAKYEVPSHQWFGIADPDGSYGVTILEDSKFASDKPTDNELRLTLLYTPGVRESFRDQHSQDWGRHDIRYAIVGHQGDWRDAGSQHLGRRFNQPLRAFVTAAHEGPLGKRFSFVSTDRASVDVRAVKLAEREDTIVVRVREMEGGSENSARLNFPSRVVSVREVDGQERVVEGEGVSADGQSVVFSLTPYLTRAFEVTLAKPDHAGAPTRSTPVTLAFDADVTSEDGTTHAGASMDRDGRTYPAEQFPETVSSGGVSFDFGPAMGDQPQAVIAKGQTITLPKGGDRVHLIVAATEDLDATFRVGDQDTTARVPAWTGFVGQWDDRVFDREFGVLVWQGDGRVTRIEPGYVKQEPLVWFATHRHSPSAPSEGNGAGEGAGEGENNNAQPQSRNESYQFSYLFRVDLDRANGANELTLADDDRVRVFAVSTSDSGARTATPAAPLYDTLDGHEAIEIRHDYEMMGYGSGLSSVPQVPSTRGLTGSGTVSTERAESFNALTMAKPTSGDDADLSRQQPLMFRYFGYEGEFLPHPFAGAAGDTLPRLNDGQVSQNNDDTRRSVWFDSDGRFGMDLRRSRTIDSVRTYSWHTSDRAPQWFTLWGSNAEEMPNPMFSTAEGSGWSLIATVDTRDLGEGGVHASEVTGADGAMGPYRWLLWVSPAKQMGTFFAEIDIDFADGE